MYAHTHTHIHAHAHPHPLLHARAQTRTLKVGMCECKSLVLEPPRSGRPRGESRTSPAATSVAAECL
eukprot:6204016-Alexandrium_andersonii.AAC.1